MAKKPVDNRITYLSFKDYDRAMVRKIESVILKDKNDKPVIDVVYSPSELIYERAMKLQKDRHGADGKSVKFPMVGIYRGSDMRLSDQNNAVTSHRRVPFQVTYMEDGQLNTRMYQTIFMDLPYQVDVYGQDESEALILLHELLFLFKRDPWFSIPKYITDNVPKELQERAMYVGVGLDTSITETSSLETEVDQGKVYRYTFNVLVNDAVLMRDVKEYMITDSIIEIEVVEEDDLESLD